MIREHLKPLVQEPRFTWVVDRSSEHGTYIYLHDKVSKKAIGEFSFQIRREYKDPLKPSLEEGQKTIAYVGMWQINDVARGNLAVIRQMFRVAIPEFKKYNAEFMVGHYVSQSGDDLTVAPYAEEMYKRMASETGGEVQTGGNVWIPVEGLAKWFKIHVPEKN